MFIVWILSYLAVFLIGFLIPCIFLAYIGIEILNLASDVKKGKPGSRYRSSYRNNRYNPAPEPEKQESTPET